MVGVTLLATVTLPSCRSEEQGGAPVAGFQTQAVATTLPAGASVVVSGYDVEAFWTRLKGTRLYTELAAIPDVREVFAPIAESQREFQAETGLALDEATLMTIFGRKFDLGFYGQLPKDRADLVLVATLDDEAQAQTLLNTLETRITAEKGVTFADVDLAGTQVRVATREGDEVLLYSVSNERLVMATTRERMQGALSLDGEDAQTMASTGDYEAVIQKLPEAAITVYVDQRALREGRSARRRPTAQPELPRASRKSGSARRPARSRTTSWRAPWVSGCTGPKQAFAPTHIRSSPRASARRSPR